MKSFIVAFTLLLTLSLSSCSKDQQHPNIIIIYTDDLGYGDVSAYGATEINTPNMDFLANNGVQFTQGYASSATCTPSRYALLTGSYPWKEKRARILPGTAPLIIDTAQITLPKMLKKQGYETAVIGKWHLGLGTGQVDWNSHISPGPNEIGFDHAYIMAATQDRVPTVYIENGTVDGLDPSDPIEISYKRNYEGQTTGKNNPELLLSMGHIQKTLGQINKAINYYHAAYKKNRFFGEAYWSLANLKTYRFSRDEILDLTEMVEDKLVNKEEQKYMHFALGTAYEDEGQYNEAFKHFHHGNQIQNQLVSYTQDAFDKECAAQRKIAVKDLFEVKSNWGSLSEEPIFIVGLPRSGSTLIEQILASHSDVDGTHELPNILSIAHKLNLRQKHPNHRYPDVLFQMSAPDFQELANSYLEGASVFRGTANYFTDKMPNNFRHIGLIRLMFPRAKIIDARRDPMDTCWSCFKQFFAEGQEFTYDLDNIFHYYHKYLEVMELWHKILPGYVHTVKHEKLLDNPEEVIRDLLNFCNLDFEDNCLSFHKNNRPVKILLRSVDVLHNWYVPQFRSKMDAVPGTVTFYWFEPNKVGEYEVLCAEYCGVGHYAMRGGVEVQDPTSYQEWLGEQETFSDLIAKQNNEIETKKVAKNNSNIEKVIYKEEK